MALRKQIITKGFMVANTCFGPIPKGEQDVVFDAYIKVESVRSDKTQMSASVKIQSDSNSFYKEYLVPVNLDGKNFIAQAYEHLKTLPEFAGATDC
jgi:hypothetical protein